MERKTDIVRIYNEDVDMIKGLFIQFSGISDFDKETRKRNYCYLRYVFMALCKYYTNASLETIGFYCGKRDHSTVIYGVREFEKHYGYYYFLKYQELYNEIAEIIKDGLSKKTNVLSIQKLEISKARSHYRVRFLRFTYNQRIVIERLKKKLENLRSREIFEQIAELPEQDINEFETRAKAFLAMKRIKYKSDV